MISSAEEFRRLRLSDDRREYDKATRDEAPEAVWFDVIAKFPEMREWVAHNKTVPLSVLQALAQDQDYKVRYVVATKRKLTAEIFSALANDPSAAVRQGLAYNAKCPHQVLNLLAQDRDELVAIAAAERLAK